MESPRVPENGGMRVDSTLADELASRVLEGLCIGMGQALVTLHIEADGTGELVNNLALTDRFMDKCVDDAYRFADRQISKKLEREAK